MNDEQFRVVSSFADAIVHQSEAKRVQLISASDYEVFALLQGIYTDTAKFSGARFNRETNRDSDVLFVDLPFGMERIDYPGSDTRRKFRKNWCALRTYLDLLSDEGLALGIVEPTAFSGTEGREFELALNKDGFFVNALLEAPGALFSPHTGIIPIIAVVTRTKRASLYVAEISSEIEADRVGSAIGILRRANATTEIGLRKVQPEVFNGFAALRALDQMNSLDTQYKNFVPRTIEDISESIISVRRGESFDKDTRNCIYFPRVGTLPVLKDAPEPKKRSPHYFQIKLIDGVSSDYLVSFFRSQLGQLVRSSIASASPLASVSRASLVRALVAIPDSEVQESVVAANEKISILRQSIEELEAEVAVNPVGTSGLHSRLDQLVEIVASLTESDRVRAYVRSGESLTVEFKQTLTLDVATQKREKYIENSALKTIAAFLNTKGGVLLVGVADDGEVTGIEDEVSKLHRSNDKFLLHFTNILRRSVGVDFYPSTEYQLVEVGTRTVLCVTCSPSSVPCFLNNTDFYVRTNPATDKLDGTKLGNYLLQHFKQPSRDV